MIENVGNLVCPAEFRVGSRASFPRPGHQRMPATQSSVAPSFVLLPSSR